VGWREWILVHGGDKQPTTRAYAVEEKRHVEPVGRAVGSRLTSTYFLLLFFFSLTLVFFSFPFLLGAGLEDDSYYKQDKGSHGYPC
jgi:hypothetical protein